MSGLKHRTAKLRQALAKREAVGLAPQPEPIVRLDSILDLLQLLGFTGESWSAWRVFLAVLFGLPITEAELAVYTEHTGRTVAPTAPFREAWCIVGRRGGKSIIAGDVGISLALRDYSGLLAPGETPIVMILAADRAQAGVVFKYVVGLLESRPELKALVVEVLKESVRLSTGVVIEVHTSDFRKVRGRTVVAAICDEISYWPTDETGSNPDTAVVAALRPSMATIPNGLLLAISTPYARKGALWEAHKRFYGHDDARVLVWQADTASMNPLIDPSVIAQAYEEDPASAAAEFGATFRSDIESLFPADVVQAAVIAGRHELPPTAGVKYYGFCDPSGGSVDSMTLAVAHPDGQRAILDCIRETKPPFDPSSVVEEFSTLLRSYGVSEIVGDRYAGEWVRDAFRKHGITYKPSERTKSQLYLELLPAVNAGRCELLDHQKLIAQLCGLERRTSRAGADSIDHAPLAHDDLSNSAAGAIALVLARPVSQFFFVGLHEVDPVAREAQREQWKREFATSDGQGFQPVADIKVTEQNAVEVGQFPKVVRVGRSGYWTQDSPTVETFHLGAPPGSAAPTAPTFRNPRRLRDPHTEDFSSEDY